MQTVTTQGYTLEGSKAVPVRLVAEQKDWLNEEAERIGVSVSQIIRMALFNMGMPKPQRRKRRAANVINK